MNAWTAVVLVSGQRMNAFDFVHYLLSPLCCFGILSAKPLVERSSCDLKHAAESRDWPLFLLLPDELQPQVFSFAKKAVAFFKMSRSILS